MCIITRIHTTKNTGNLTNFINLNKNSIKIDLPENHQTIIAQLPGQKYWTLIQIDMTRKRRRKKLESLCFNFFIIRFLYFSGKKRRKT